MKTLEIDKNEANQILNSLRAASRRISNLPDGHPLKDKDLIEQLKQMPKFERQPLGTSSVLVLEQAEASRIAGLFERVKMATLPSGRTRSGVGSEK